MEEKNIMKQSQYKLKDFSISYANVAKIVWNDKVLYDDTLVYHDPCLSSITTLKAIRVEYMNKTVHNINMEIQNNHEIILTVVGEE